MIKKQIDTTQKPMPIPLSFLIHTANGFHCDIYIQCNEGRINVKNYDDMLLHLRPHSHSLVFFFNGFDEQAAGQKIEQLFMR